MSKKNSLIHKRKSFEDIELSMLCHQIALVLKAGINPLEGIPLIAEDMVEGEIKSSLLGISQKMLDGLSMFHSFQSTGQYPAYMLHMIDIGETTGTLEAVMDSLSSYYENESDMKKRLKNAIAYPIVLGLLMLGIIALLILKIIPLFGEVLMSLGGQVPAEAEILFDITLVMKKSFMWLILGLLMLFCTIFIILKTQKGRLLFDEFKVKNPLTGPLYRKIVSSRLSYGLSLTIQSGMKEVVGLTYIKGLINNEFINDQINMGVSKLTQGANLSDAIKEMGIFPELFVRMIRTGERSGEMDSMLQKLSRVYAKESELSLRRFSSSVEPTLVILLSAVMGVILLSVLLPLIGIMSSIG